MKPAVAVYEYKNLQLDAKDISITEGIITGYASAFDIQDSDGDTIRRGAFTKSIQEQGPNSIQPRVKYLLNHDVGLPVGKILTLEEDSYGLKYTAKIGSNAAGQDYLKMIESGLITEHSIGYKVVKSTNPDANKWKREIQEIKVYEISGLSGWAANQYTPILGVKSEEQLNLAVKRLERLEKFCRNSDATDETIELLLMEVKQLTQLTIDLREKQTTEPGGTTQPEEESADANINKADMNIIALHLLTL